MLIALPVLPLEASTIVSPGCSRPSRSARSTMYLAIRALTDPDGLRNSSLTQMSSTRISGVSPIPSRTVAVHGSTAVTVLMTPRKRRQTSSYICCAVPCDQA